jgi:hypothetical protein
MPTHIPLHRRELGDDPIAQLRHTNVRALKLLDAVAHNPRADRALYQQMIADFQVTHEKVSRLLDKLESQEAATVQSEAYTALEQRMAAMEAENGDLANRMVSLENRAGQMMNLFVATYQLYAAQDEEEVLATIGEIAVDLLGAERFVLLQRDDENDPCQVILARGFAEGYDGFYASETYAGGDELVDQALLDGVLRLGGEGVEALAVVPLKVQNLVAGALVIFKLFEHKPALSSDDREILDLLAAHAASALFAARAFALTHRKMQSLQSLVRLLRGES